MAQQLEDGLLNEQQQVKGQKSKIDAKNKKEKAPPKKEQPQQQATQNPNEMKNQDQGITKDDTCQHDNFSSDQSLSISSQESTQENENELKSQKQDRKQQISSTEDACVKGTQGQKSVKEDQKVPKQKNTGKDAPLASGEETKVVLSYMRQKNRPFSLINIYDNLHGKIQKPALQKLLDELSDQGELSCQEFGQAQVYLYNQKNIPEVNTLELQKMKEDLSQSSDQVQEVQQAVKLLNKSLAYWMTQLTNVQVQDQILKFTQQIDVLDKKLEFYKSDKYEQISDETMKKAEDLKNQFEKQYQQRKRWCKEGIKQLAEGLDQQVPQLIELIGIDDD